MYLKSRTFLFILVLTVASLFGVISALAQTPEPPLPPELDELLTELDIDLYDIPISMDGEIIELITAIGIPMD